MKIVCNITVLFILLALMAICSRYYFANGLYLRSKLKDSTMDSFKNERIHVIQVSPFHKRTRRTAHYLRMPRQLHFRFRREGINTDLRMTRVGAGGPNTLFPVYTLRGYGPSKILDLPPDLLKNIAFYRLEDQRRILVVNRSHDWLYSLDGSLNVKGQEYVIAPDVRTQAGLGQGHILSKAMFSSVVNSDTILPDEAVDQQVYSVQSNSSDSCPTFWRRYIELTMVTDFAVYQRFKNYTDRGRLLTIANMYVYYGFIALSVSTRFESLSDYCPFVRVKVTPLRLSLCMRPSRCPWSEDHVLSDNKRINAQAALRAFRMFAASPNGPKGDHRMFFSGYQLARESGDTSVLGIAYLGTACNNNWDMSIVEENFGASTASIAAHELGHGFSAIHDNSAGSVGCSNSDRYIMTSFISFPTSDQLASRPYQFSNCSAKKIFDHLSGDKGSCTKNRPRFNMRTQYVAGQFFNADRQCELTKGAGSYFCREIQSYWSFSQMCVRTMCSNPQDHTKCTGIIPLHHTSCGNKKWCEKGRCVESRWAPSTLHDECPQGDDPKARCKLPSSCVNDTMIRIVCCRTCRDFLYRDDPLTTLTTVPMTSTDGLTSTTATQPPITVFNSKSELVWKCIMEHNRPKRKTGYDFRSRCFSQCVNFGRCDFIPS